MPPRVPPPEPAGCAYCGNGAGDSELVGILVVARIPQRGNARGWVCQDFEGCEHRRKCKRPQLALEV